MQEEEGSRSCKKSIYSNENKQRAAAGAPQGDLIRGKKEKKKHRFRSFVHHKQCRLILKPVRTMSSSFPPSEFGIRTELQMKKTWFTMHEKWEGNVHIQYNQADTQKWQRSRAFFSLHYNDLLVICKKGESRSSSVCVCCRSLVHKCVFIYWEINQVIQIQVVPHRLSAVLLISCNGNPAEHDYDAAENNFAHVKTRKQNV